MKEFENHHYSDKPAHKARGEAKKGAVELEKQVKKKDARCLKCGERILADENGLCGNCI